jgi:isopentenyldiphosphate isomerase
MQEVDELLDLVNDNDVVIGQVRRGDFASPDFRAKGNVRGAGLFIVNDAGKLWTPKRSLQKRQWPGGYDFSAAEHVAAGESYEQAIIRGAHEELGVNFSAGDMQLLGMLHPDRAQDFPLFHAVYTVQHNASPPYNPDDYSGYEWLTPAELLAKLQAGSPAKTALALAVKKFLLKEELWRPPAKH